MRRCIGCQPVDLFLADAPRPAKRGSPINTMCLVASLPGLFMSLLFSSGNHGIGIGITENRVALGAIGIATNALLYGWLTWLIWRLVARRSLKEHSPIKEAK